MPVIKAAPFALVSRMAKQMDAVKIVQHTGGGIGGTVINDKYGPSQRPRLPHDIGDA